MEKFHDLLESGQITECKALDTRAALDIALYEMELWGFWEAFWTLSNSRIVNFGCVGFIPITEIESYIRISGIDDAPRFLHHIRAMDAIYVKYRNEKLAETK